MRVLFDAALDGEVWPIPLGDRQSAVGETFVGPLGLLDLLETALGLGGRTHSRARRAAALVPAVRAMEGFWSASAQVDPLGVARELLRWRDSLWLQGWRGQPLPGRIGQLAAVTRAALPGYPDRLAAVSEALTRRPVGIKAIRLLRSGQTLPGIWREVIERLQAAGTDVQVQPLRETPACGDLAAARSNALVPQGDGSLQLVRPPGPWQGAEDLAAWLAAQPADELANTVVIGADVALDSALHRYGLPTTGAPGSAAENVLLQVLPLVLAMGWDPPDPRRAIELLTLPSGWSPVPGTVAGGLAIALRQWPAVDSDTWRKRLQEGLDRIAQREGDDRAARVRARLEALLAPCVRHGSRYPAEEARRRSNALLQWLQGRIQGVADGSAGRWGGAIAQCATFNELLELSGLQELPAPQLQRFLDEATAESPTSSPYRQEAGLVGLRSPGALVGPAERVVWWNFMDGQSSPERPLPLLPEETEALRAAGVCMLSPGAQALQDAEHWRRPLLQATGQLVLVCPQGAADGEPAYPHPLWDEIVGRIPEESKRDVDLLHSTVPQAGAAPSKVMCAVTGAPVTQRGWHLPDKAPRRRADDESPSSVEILIGCPFRWVVKYLARVSGGRTTSLPPKDRLVGSVAHEIIALLLRQELTSPEDAANRAAVLFDGEGPRLGAELFLAGGSAARAEARSRVSAAARRLVAVLKESELAVLGVEEDVAKEAFGLGFAGRTDLIVGRDGPAAVIDLKWGSANSYRERLEQGKAHQLAAYSYLVGAGDFLPVAYFVLNTQELLTTDTSGTFRQAIRQQGPGPRDTWRALSNAVERAYALIDAGEAPALGLPTEDGEQWGDDQPDSSDVLTIDDPCRYCDCGPLCGRSYTEVQ